MDGPQFICILGIAVPGALVAWALWLGIDGSVLAAFIGLVTTLGGIYIGKSLEKRAIKKGKR